ncbi:hypothetical protein SCFA_1780003 [anaerobic digester metagenome]|uniref:Uncharacterized protein n=1 Tax=anaerobic digester metagenome TaxID=1263854 RepID=A0A485LXM1_9ZZZZ
MKLRFVKCFGGLINENTQGTRGYHYKVVCLFPVSGTIRQKRRCYHIIG